MDFSSFGDENWEVKKWLNSAFEDISREKRDSHAATLLTKLQLVSQGWLHNFQKFISNIIPRKIFEFRKKN